MINFILAFLVSCSSFAAARDGRAGTTGFTTSEAGKEMTTQEFAGRFQVSGDLFVTSADGKRLLYKISESRTGKPLEDNVEVYSNWGHTLKAEGKTIGIYISYLFRIEKDATVKVHIQQFESMSNGGLNGEVVHGKLLREEHLDLTDFAPINWVAYQDSKMKIIARITPLLLDRGSSFGPDNMPIALDHAVMLDGSGKLWGDDLSEGGGKFLAIATHKGTVAMSYYPFKGAKELGLAKGNEIHLDKVKPSLTLRNTKPFLTANGEMKVYGMILPDRKTDHLQSINMIVTDKEPEFVGSLK